MKCVLITGATAGIGKEIAYSYASRGYDLFLVARREKGLIEISKQISDKYNVNVNHLVSDLKDKNSPKKKGDFVNNPELHASLKILSKDSKSVNTGKISNLIDKKLSPS